MFVNPDFATRFATLHYNSKRQSTIRLTDSILSNTFYLPRHYFTFFRFTFEHKKLVIQFSDSFETGMSLVPWRSQEADGKRAKSFDFGAKTIFIQKCDFEDTFDIKHFRMVKLNSIFKDNLPTIDITQVLPDFQYYIDNIGDSVPKVITDNIDTKYFRKHFYDSFVLKVNHA